MMVNRKEQIPYTFTYFYYEKICAMTLEGLTLKKASVMHGMPPVQVLYYWNKRFPCLRIAIKSMKNSRKEYLLENEIDKRLSDNFIKSCPLDLRKCKE